jgi:hypothetical protein
VIGEEQANWGFNVRSRRRRTGLFLLKRRGILFGFCSSFLHRLVSLCASKWVACYCLIEAKTTWVGTTTDCLFFLNLGHLGRGRFLQSSADPHPSSQPLSPTSKKEGMHLPTRLCVLLPCSQQPLFFCVPTDYLSRPLQRFV